MGLYKDVVNRVAVNKPMYDHVHQHSTSLSHSLNTHITIFFQILNTAGTKAQWVLKKLFVSGYRFMDYFSFY